MVNIEHESSILEVELTSKRDRYMAIRVLPKRP